MKIGTIKSVRGPRTWQWVEGVLLIIFFSLIIFDFFFIHSIAHLGWKMTTLYAFYIILFSLSILILYRRLRVHKRFFDVQTVKQQKQIADAQDFNRILFGILEDVQLAKEQAEAAKLAVLKTAVIVETSKDAIIGKNLDGTVTSWNKAAEDIFGYSAEEMIGRSIKTIIPSTHLPEFERFMKTLREGGNIKDLETKRIRKDEKIIDVSLTISPINAGGQIIGASAIARDITQRLRDQKKFKMAVEAAPCGMFMLDLHANVLLANTHAERLFGYQNEELLNRDMGLLIPQIAAHRSPKGIIDYNKIEGLFNQKAVDFECLKMDGSVFFAEVGVNPLLTEQGVICLVSVVDITPRKEAEARIQKILQDLSAANEKLKELDELKTRFLMVASHEIRTPLSSITGYVELMLAEKPGTLTEEQRTFVTHIQHASLRLQHMIKNLLSLSKIESNQIDLELQWINPAELIEEEVEMLLQNAHSVGVNLTKKIDKNVGSVLIDSNIFSEIVVNLVSNALKYTQEGGHVEVILDQDDGCLRLRVRDNGIGISGEKLSYVFQPFKRVHGRGIHGEESVGLGLALVKRFVDLLNGTIELDSEENKGTLMTVKFPLRDKGSFN